MTQDEIETRLRYMAQPERELRERLTFAVWSTSSNPYEQGEIEVDVSPSHLKIRWSGDAEWAVLDWHELAILGGNLPEIVRSNIEHEKEKAYNEGIQLLSEHELEAIANIRSKIRIATTSRHLHEGGTQG